jgi:PKD repeat protein
MKYNNKKRIKVEQIVKNKEYLFYAVVLVLILILGFCKAAVLTAPDNTTLIVTVNPPVIPLGGQAVVKVVAFKASGTPVPDGTVIFFSCDIGTIESRKETLSGTAEVLFQSNDNRSGVATITVTSGNATVTPEAITITIGASGLSSLSLTADPPVLPVGGGASTLRVTAFDENFNPLANIPVTLSTNAGQLNSSGNVITTNANGAAEDLLTTTVTANVTALSGEVETSITVHVETNEGPTASFVYSPTSPKLGEKVNFNASGSSDPDDSIVSYQWDFGDGRSDSGEKVTHKYKTAGTFTVVLVVEDNSGNRGSTSQTVSVSEGDSPTASFVYSPTNPAENENIYFNASESEDPDGDIVSFDWDFGDGTSGTGKTVTHQYGSSGSYTVLLKVTDDDGNIDTASQTVSVGDNQNPVASFFFTPSNPVVNQVIQFNATDSNDPDGTIEEYQWEMGDGTTLYGYIITYQYSSSGTYTVYLRVTDNSDNTGSTSQPITVSDNQSPTASFVYSPTSPVIDEPVYFNAAESTDPDGSIDTYQWYFGDGVSVSGKKNQVEHTYLDAGTYTVVLVVTDDSGNTDSVSKTVTVTDNSTPIASFTYSPSNPNAGEEVTFDASGSKDPDGGNLTYFWSFGHAGNTGTAMIETYTYSTVGTYTVSLTVEDEEGKTATKSQTVKVN